MGERVLVRYVDLLEDFSFGKAHLATLLVTLRGASDVRAGRLAQQPGTMDLVRTVRSSQWQGYHASFRGRLVDGAEWAVYFAASETGTSGTGSCYPWCCGLQRVDAGSFAFLAIKDRVPFAGLRLTIHVLFHPDNSDRIRIDMDGESIFDLDDGTHRTGTVGLEVGPTTTADWDRIEVFELPIDMDVIAPREVAP